MSRKNRDLASAAAVALLAGRFPRCFDERNRRPCSGRGPNAPRPPALSFSKRGVPSYRLDHIHKVSVLGDHFD
jgi:hypothetical protein